MDFNGWMVILSIFAFLVLPIVALVAMIKPKWFRSIATTRLRLFGVFLGLWILSQFSMFYFLPTKFTVENESIKQEEVNQTEPTLEERKASIERIEKLVDRLDRTYGGMSSKITLDEYNKIEMGMTHQQVKNIVGGAGKITAQSEVAGISSVVVEFEGSGDMGANANVTFQDGRVVAKAQYGLR